jgi:hypothetical protein
MLLISLSFSGLSSAYCATVEDIMIDPIQPVDSGSEFDSNFESDCDSDSDEESIQTVLNAVEEAIEDGGDRIDPRYRQFLEDQRNWLKEKLTERELEQERDEESYQKFSDRFAEVADRARRNSFERNPPKNPCTPSDRERYLGAVWIALIFGGYLVLAYYS